MGVTNDTFYCPVSMKQALDMYSKLIGTSRSEIIENALYLTLEQIKSGELPIKEIKSSPKVTKQIVSVSLHKETKDALLKIHENYHIKKNDIYILAITNFFGIINNLILKINAAKIAENKESIIFDKNEFINIIGSDVYNSFKENFQEYSNGKSLVLIDKENLKKILKYILLR